MVFAIAGQSSSRKRRDESKVAKFKEKIGLRLVVLAVVMVWVGTRPTPYNRRYVPLQVTDGSQIYRPSMPFPGIFDISFPKANFLVKIRKKPADVKNESNSGSDENNLKSDSKENTEEKSGSKEPAEEEFEIKPTIKPKFGKKRYFHYNDAIFVSNSGMDYLTLMGKANFEKIGTQAIQHILEARTRKTRKPKLKPPKIPPYYQNLIAQYDPKTQFYDEYTEQQFYIDLLNFVNKAEDRLHFFRTKRLSAHNPFLHGVGQLTIDLMNQYRRSKGLPGNISWSEPLYFSMLNHSIHMSNIGELTHDDFKSRSATAKQFYDIKSSAENLAFFNPNTPFSRVEIAEKFMDLWINSPPHRVNLEGDFNVGSVSIFENFDGDYWATMFLVKV